MSNNYSDQQYMQSQDRLTTLLSALRANRVCKTQRKSFNTIRATVSGQVEPSLAKNAAIDLIDCYQRVNSITSLVEQRKSALQCLKGNGNCEAAITAYVNAD